MLTTTLRSMTIAVALALGTPILAGAAGSYGPGSPVITPHVAPSADEAVDLTYMREEEKAARDLYLVFADAWGSVPFAFIANSEQNHMDAMLRLLRKYRLADPAAGALAGEYQDAELQALYTALVEKGLASELDALLVGGLVEEVDLLDLEFSAARTTKADIAAAYANLACGSRNHLRAFAASVKVATSQAYLAQTMSQAAVDAILMQPRERCGPN